MNREKKEEYEEAFKIVAPVASLCGVTKEETEEVIKYIDEMSVRGLSGSESAILLRKHLMNKRGLS